MPKPLRFRQRLDRYPPILVRLCATRGRGANKRVLTDQQIADASGLTIAQVKFIAYSTTWREIGDGLKYPFLDACDIDLEKRRTFRRLEAMRRRGCFRYLRADPNWGQWEELLEIGAEAGLWN